MQSVEIFEESLSINCGSSNIVQFLTMILFLAVPSSFNSVAHIFAKNTFQEVAFTHLTCFINQISFFVYLKMNFKNRFFKKTFEFIHKVFVYLNVIVTGIEACLYLYLWLSVPNGLQLYSLKEADMAFNEQLISFILIRLIPFMASLLIFYMSNQRVSMTSIISALTFFPFYFLQIKNCFKHYGMYPHPFIAKLSQKDMLILCILLTSLTLALHIPLDLFKKLQLRYRSEKVKSEDDEISFFESAANTLGSWYCFISNSLFALDLSIADLHLPEWFDSTIK